MYIVTLTSDPTGFAGFEKHPLFIFLSKIGKNSSNGCNIHPTSRNIVVYYPFTVCRLFTNLACSYWILYFRQVFFGTPGILIPTGRQHSMKLENT